MKLPKNESTLDRIIRIVVGLSLLVVGFIWLTGVTQIVAFIIGTVALVTGLVGTCGLYMLCGGSTCPIKK
jgi:hypothetical protein